ncbi:hypothetical protein LTS08_006865 [Lithohypha guttulata]|uniref:uncharacterized protein n=1 Tax=Lithohypha guttulata TaxID=1690604 RepID=UPI002DDFF7E8|nr:hypothetical protein LTR51_001918 [Lithohypha guttulata]KAK5097453.1 hypothetical protein LTS08_006865 [Lithohypha guttulata]
MRLSSLVCLSLASAALAYNKAAVDAFKRPAKKRAEIIKKHGHAAHPALPQKRSLEARQSSRFLNNATQKFVVNGSAIPDVNFDIGESYAGLLPISDNPNESRQLYFWFVPSINPAASDEITIWFNGGPGCSSLSGLLTENGPFLWQAGTLAPTPNSYSWSNLTNMLWVEQPVGVGYSQGNPNITNEVELGLQFTGFYKQFVDAFQVHGSKVYLTGESYAGMYVPYIADAFITANDTDYYNLSGIAINDPIIGDATIQQQVVILPFVEYWSNLFYLNETFMSDLRDLNQYCNYTQYMEKYYTFPPPQESFPVLPDPYATENGCYLFDYVLEAAIAVNPCFDLYHITATCPFAVSQLGIVNPGDYEPPGAQVYFNRTDVQKAINAPVGTNWMQCTDKNVFNYGYVNNYTIGDTSLGPAQDGVLQRVVEHTGNVMIGSGNLDLLLNPNGTVFALQNMTWNGAKGFQQDPMKANQFYVPYHPEYNGGRLSEAGYVGTWGEERGLLFYTVQLSGHELPGYAAGSGYRVLEKLLGRVSNLAEVSDFTTQRGGNYQAMGTSSLIPSASAAEKNMLPVGAMAHLQR